jgi:hypothetical protein
MSKSLQACSFNGKLCNISDFSWFFSYIYGNCFQFNAGEILKSTELSGSNYGLWLYLGNLENSNKYPTFIANGLRVFIHNSSFLSSSAEQVLVEMGKLTSVAIKKTLTYRSPWPYSECLDDNDSKSDLVKYMRNVNGVYRQSDCLELCLQKIIMSACNCFIPGVTIFKNNSLNSCFSSNETICLLNTFAEFSKYINKQCGDQCPLECDFVNYELTASTLDYPSEEFFDDLQTHSSEYANITIDEFRKANLVLNIFYPSKEYTEIREVPKMSIIDLISNLGGVLGIFLGFSIFSFIEMFEIMIRVSVLLFKK